MSYGQFQLRRDTAANWTSANPTLLAGEFGFETDTLAIKLGDGATAWNSLGYYSTKIRNGTTVPSSGLGVVGDFYIRTTTADLYLKTAVSTWTLEISLIGPTGPTGPTGPAGAVNTVTALDTSVAVAGTTNVTVSRGPLTGDVTSSTGTQATTVAKIQSQPVASTTPLVGQKLSYQSAGWTPRFDRFSVGDFGADGTGNGDVTVPIYNAIISSLITRTAASQTTVTSQTTATGTFSLPVATNTLSTSGTLLVQTTAGTIKMGYTGGGGSTTLTGCTVSAGTSGGLILSGVIIGTQANTGGSIYPQGGEIYFPNGAYIISQPIVIPAHSVKLIGAASSADSDTGSIVSTGSAILYWNGAVGATMVSYNPTWSGQQAIQGAEATNLVLDCAGVAGIGLQFISCHEWKRTNVTVLQPILTAYDFDVVAGSWLGGSEAEDVTRGTSIGCSYRCIDGTPGTITLTTTSTVALNTFTGSQSLALSGTPSGWPTTNGVIIVEAINQITGAVSHYLLTYGGGGNTSTLTSVTALPVYSNSPEETTTTNFLPTAKLFSGALIRQAVPANAMGNDHSGSATANSCCSTFIMDTGKYFNGAGNWLGNSDSHDFVNCLHNLTAGGVGKGYDVQGSTLSGASGSAGASRNNQWYSGSAGNGGIVLRGTESYGYLQPASANDWQGYEMANGEPLPVSGTGCHFTWTGNGLLKTGVYGVSTANGSFASGATGLIPGTTIIVPPQGIQIGLCLEWIVPVSKTAAGTSLGIGVKFGTANTASDANVATTTYTGTAAIDAAAIYVRLVVTSVGASATALANITMLGRAGTTTGLATTALAGAPTAMTMSTFNSGLPNPGPAYFNLAVTANTATVLTVLTPVTANILKAANP